MNENHAKLMPSPEWAAHIQDEVLPQATAGVELGTDLLELGPGPGAATEWLRHRVSRLVAVEHEEEAAGRLAGRFAGTNVEVVSGDAAALGYPDASFDTVATCTMLHHVPTRALQDKVLAEAFRVLRPGGTFLGSDSLPSDDLHQLPRGRHVQPGRAGRVPHPAADRRLRRDHPARLVQPGLHRAQGERVVTADRPAAAAGMPAQPGLRPGPGGPTGPGRPTLAQAVEVIRTAGQRPPRPRSGGPREARP